MLIATLVLILIGYLSLRRYFQVGQTGWLFGAFVCFAVGTILSLFWLEVRLPILGRLQFWRLSVFWPSFVWATASACFATFVLTGFRRGRLFLAGLGLSIWGSIAFMYTLHLQSIAATWSGETIWPVSISLLGLILLLPILLKIGYLGFQKRDHRH
ncbi:MAG: hypothetical protein AAF629_06405 [Chloroflexota bacterium]